MSEKTMRQIINSVLVHANTPDMPLRQLIDAVAERGEYDLADVDEEIADMLAQKWLLRDAQDNISLLDRAASVSEKLHMEIVSRLLNSVDNSVSVDVLIAVITRSTPYHAEQIQEAITDMCVNNTISLDMMNNVSLLNIDSYDEKGEYHTPEDDIANGVHYKAVVITQDMVGQPLDPMMIDHMYQQVGQPLTLAQNTIIKKTLAAGKRGKKSRRQDMLDVIGSAKRQIALWAMGGDS